MGKRDRLRKEAIRAGEIRAGAVRIQSQRAPQVVLACTRCLALLRLPQQVATSEKYLQLVIPQHRIDCPIRCHWEERSKAR